MPVSPRRSPAAVADSADPFDADDAASPAPFASGSGTRRAGPKRGADGRLAQPAAAAPDADGAAASDEAGAAGAKRKKKPAADKPVKTADKLAKLGLTRSIDLVLHLPMRYEDETTLTPIGELLPGGIAQTEGVVFDNEVAYRPRRQLVVKIRDDDGEQLVLRFLNFYGSQVKQMAVGQRLRVRGDAHGRMHHLHPEKAAAHVAAHA
ncbi:ATP-dependent DNA helicase RecG, partial [Burkholderia cenocepacia]|nr:ATP-dependent DNA helicase RecG [Burkholderia cenocepacia]